MNTMTPQETVERVTAFVEWDVLLIDAKNAADVEDKDSACFSIAENIRACWYERFPDDTLDEDALCKLIEAQLKDIEFIDGQMIYS